MSYHHPDCMGNYDFDNIALFARKRFIEGRSLLELFQKAKSNRRRQEITLVSQLGIENNSVEDLELSCQYKEQCKVTTCRVVLKQMIENILPPDQTSE